MTTIQKCVLLLAVIGLANTTTTSGKHHKVTSHGKTHRRARVEEGDDAMFFKDILDWTEKHADTNSVLRRKLSLDGLKARVQMAKVATHDDSSTCVQRTVKSCDLRAMAQLQMLEDSPCTLLQEYEMCVVRETSFCKSGEAALLKASIRHLVTGLQQQGHCAGVTLKPEVSSRVQHVQPVRPCLRKGAWMCMTSFVEDLKMADVPTCASVANFRHCLHMRSSSCDHGSADLLIRGSKGLSRLYRRLTHQC